MNTLVSFEIAKLLKEKGFDLITRKSWRISIDPEKHNYTKPVTDEDTYFHNVKESYSAPTIAEVIMWLYKKHKIWIELKMYLNGSFYYEVKKQSDIGWRKIAVNMGSGEIYWDTPQAGFIDAIESILNHVIK